MIEIRTGTSKIQGKDMAKPVLNGSCVQRKKSILCGSVVGRLYGNTLISTPTAILQRRVACRALIIGTSVGAISY